MSKYCVECIIIAIVCLSSLFTGTSSSAKEDTIEDLCRKSCTYRDRKAYYLDKSCYRSCVVDAHKEAERRKEKRLQEEANKAIIELNRTYQENQRYYPHRR